MNKFFALSLLIVVAFYSSEAQQNYTININRPEKQIISGHLDLGGSNPSGETISVNSYFIEKAGKPFFPVIGEFHYSRYPQEYWEESIRKMKVGGINTIATYVFWNIHERQEGTFDWQADLNLRRFIELVKKNELFAIVRVGPFCHGEMRNGGLPDWLYGRAFEVRSNDPEYLVYVDRLYNEIASQVKGLLYKDGGPVIGIQLENEYQHSAAPWEFTYPGSKKERTAADRDAALTHEQITVTDGKNPWSEYGKKHMNKLKKIAQENELDVPLYTATGWGNATIVEKGSLPVTAGYAYPFWAEPSPSNFYLFKDIQQNPDYSPVSYDTQLYPSISAEIGPGIQVKHSRRPVVDYKSVNPLMVRIIGSGSNGIGYYMYHGGSTPAFNGKFYNEEANGIPRINYDFQAPIGQYGQVRYHFKHLRMLHYFLESYGELLAPMKTILPETNAAITKEDTETLRYAVRSYGESGFIFAVNFQDHIEMKDIEEVSLDVRTKTETISFPTSGTFTLLKGTSAILPFNLKLEDALVKSATVQPFTTLKSADRKYYVFSMLEGIDPCLAFPSDTKITNRTNTNTSKENGLQLVKAKTDEPFSFEANDTYFLILPHKMALNCTKINDTLFISDALLLEEANGIEVISRNTNNTIHVFPESKNKELSGTSEIEKTKAAFKGFSSYQLRFTEEKPDITIEQISKRKYTLQADSSISNLHDVFVSVDYVGDRGLAFIKGQMITDHFYHDRKWEISLRKFAPLLKEEKMVFVFHLMYADYPYLKDLENIPEFNNGSYLNIKDFEIIPEYKATLSF